MEQIRSVLIAGAGSIGSMVASVLHEFNPSCVSILAGGERKKRYERGFLINGRHYSFTLSDPAERQEYDLIIIACKNHHLGQVLEDIRHKVGKETLMLSLLNGISSEDEIGAVYGRERIPYAMIIGTDAGMKGNRVTFSKTGTIFFGDREENGPRSDRVSKIASFFTQTGVCHQVSPNMYNRLWFKFMMNVGLNQVSAITRKGYRIFKSDTRVAEACELFDAAMLEVAAVARKEGVELTEEDRAVIYRTIDTLSDDGKTSMCQDVEAGRKTEVELFGGKMIELGEKHGIPVPVNEMLYRLIKTIESR